MIWSRSDERREVRHVGDVEEDRADPDEESDDEELPQREHVREVRDRDRGEEHGAAEVAVDEDRSPREPVDPDPGRQREEDERQELDRPERRDLERARVQDEDRDERERELRDLRPEVADRLGRPELQEVGVPPEAAGRPEPRNRRSSAGRASWPGRAPARVRRAPVRRLRAPEVGDEPVEATLEAACVRRLETCVEEGRLVRSGRDATSSSAACRSMSAESEPLVRPLGRVRRSAGRRAAPRVRSTSRSALVPCGCARRG